MIAEPDDFEIHENEVLDRDEQGTVYRGRQRSRARDVALRVIRDAGADDPALAHRFREEVERLARLEDPNLVRLYGAGQWTGRFFYATEPVRGELLAAHCSQGIRFTSEEILHVADGVGRALNAARKGGVEHCDVRPSTILLCNDGSVKLTDLALWRPSGEAADEHWRGLRRRYASSEEARGEPPDVRSAIYSLGVVLYELAAGKPPFEGYDSATSFVFQLLHDAPTPPRQLGAPIPADLERLILRCLSKDPEDRYANPEEFLQDVKATEECIGHARTAGSLEDELGDFEIHEEQVLAEGGMGTLYRGRQKRLRRPVVIKVIRRPYAADPEFVQRFRREFELLAELNDPHVVQVFGTGVWQGCLFYAMELVEGKNVAARLEEEGRLGLREALHIAEGVARALSAMWHYRIVHRDITPSNILITPAGQVKMADFGLAKSLRLPAAGSRVISGTSEYVSPEQGFGMAVDTRSDIYSLGVVLYELLAGHPPFRSTGSFTRVMCQHAHVAPPPLDEVTGPLPQPLVDLVMRCLAKRPEDRFQTPDELLAEIAKVRAALARAPDGLTPVSPKGRVVRTLRRAWRRARRAAQEGMGRFRMNGRP